MKKVFLIRKLLFCVVVLYWYSLYVHVPVQTTFLYKLGASAGYVGIIIAAYGLGQFLLRIPLGIKSDYSGKIFPFLFLGTIMGPISAVFRLLFSTPWAFLLANILGGISAAIWISLLIFFGQLFLHDELHSAMAYATTGHSTAMLTSTLSCAILIGTFGMKGIAVAEIIAGIISVVLTTLVFFLYEYRLYTQTKLRIATLNSEYMRSQGLEANDNLVTGADIRAVLQNKRLWKFSALAFVHQGLIISLVMSFVANQAASIGADNQQIAISTFLYWIVTVFVNAMAGKPLMMRLGAKFWLPFALFLASMYCLLLVNIQSVTALYLLQMVGGIFGGTVLPFSMSEALREIKPKVRGTGIGVYQAILAGGMVILPLLAGALIQVIGMEGGFYTMSFIAVLTSIYAYTITRSL